MEHGSPEQRERWWRQAPAEDERAAVRQDPGLAQEARLTAALRGLPDRPVASNFTARVLAAVELEERQAAREQRSAGRRSPWLAWLPRVAGVTAVLFAGFFGVQHHELVARRAELAQSLSVVASARRLPDVEALNNFEAIQRMAQAGRADTDLLAALQ